MARFSDNGFRRGRWQGPAEIVAPVCPHCGGTAVKVQSNYGPRWLCAPCDATVGCHPNGAPLGTLAKKPLREARTRVHKAFDKLWLARPGEARRMSRTDAYALLARLVGVERDQCHVAMFDLDQCETALARLALWERDELDDAPPPVKHEPGIGKLLAEIGRRRRAGEAV